MERHCRQERFGPNSNGLRRAGAAFGSVFRRRVALLRPAAGVRGMRVAGPWRSSIGTVERLSCCQSVVSRAQDERQGFGGRHLAAPGFEFVDLGVAALFLQFVKANGQIAQGGQDLRGSTLGGLTGVLAEGVVAAVMRAVLDGRPVVADDFEQFLVGMLFLAQAGGVIADLHAGGFGRQAQQDPFALHGDDLPAAAQSDFLRADGHPGDAAALKPVMALFPGRLLFRREKKTGPRANAAPCPAPRSDFL